MTYRFKLSDYLTNGSWGTGESDIAPTILEFTPPTITEKTAARFLHVILVTQMTKHEFEKTYSRKTEEVDDLFQIHIFTTTVEQMQTFVDRIQAILVTYGEADNRWYSVIFLNELTYNYTGGRVIASAGVICRRMGVPIG